MRGSQDRIKLEKGSTEIVVIGLVCSLIILVVIPVLNDVSEKSDENLQNLCIGVNSRWTMETPGGQYGWAITNKKCNTEPENVEQGGGGEEAPPPGGFEGF